MPSRSWEINKLVIFDLDGVLVDSRDIHYEALNRAIGKEGKEFTITREEHLLRFDGLGTSQKLKLLTELKGLPASSYEKIWNSKQRETIKMLEKIPVNETAIKIMKQLKEKGWKISVASNAIRETVLTALNSTGTLKYVSYVVSNEDVKHPKPFPEMYWRCMIAMNTIPQNTIVIEDSHVGRAGALSSGAHLYAIKNSEDLDFDDFNRYINQFSPQEKIKVPWKNKRMNILIPMAGAGSRFVQAGFTFPKPLIEIDGKPMIQKVVENINVDARFIFIVQKSHFEKYNLAQLLKILKPNCEVVVVDGITQGAACTTLLASDFINNSEPLLIANSDQLIEWNSNECLYALGADDVDGGILIFKSTHPKWSFVKIEEDGFVREVAEKNPISDNATVGIYYWKHGSDYVKYANKMIKNEIRTNNEFYVCPVYNEAILDGKKIKAIEVEKMWGLGTPEDLKYYLENRV